jgi:hypothetical protein
VDDAGELDESDEFDGVDEFDDGEGGDELADLVRAWVAMRPGLYRAANLRRPLDATPLDVYEDGTWRSWLAQHRQLASEAGELLPLIRQLRYRTRAVAGRDAPGGRDQRGDGDLDDPALLREWADIKRLAERLLAARAC